MFARFPGEMQTPRESGGRRGGSDETGLGLCLGVTMLLVPVTEDTVISIRSLWQLSV